MNLYYWIYGRLNISVALSDAEVTDAFQKYADAHIKGGRDALTQDHIDGVLAEHHDAQDLYTSMRF